jgi:hypothetical protein
MAANRNGQQSKEPGRIKARLQGFFPGDCPTKAASAGPAVDLRAGRGFSCPVFSRVTLLILAVLFTAASLRAQEAVRGFVSVEPFEFRLEALVKVGPYREAWRLEGDAIGPAERQAVLDNLSTLFESGANLTVPGAEPSFTDRTARFVVPDAEKGFATDERDEIPIDEALVGLTRSAAVRGVNAFDLEWIWFAPGQERLVVEVASRGKPSARLLTPSENRMSWKLDGESALPALLPVPDCEKEERRPLRPLALAGAAMVVAAAAIVLRRKTKSPAWVGWLLVGGLAWVFVSLRYRIAEVKRPGGAAVEDLVYALLRNTYHAFDFRDESSIYDTLEASVTGPLLEKVYLEMRESLELENAGGPRVRVHEIALRECRPVAEGGAVPGEFKTRAEWVTVGEVSHWGHTHERTNRYEAELQVVPSGKRWKISGLDLLNEERIQKVSRNVAEPAAPSTTPAPETTPAPAKAAP